MYLLEYHTKYPRSVIITGKRRDLIIDPDNGIEEMNIVAGEKFPRVYQALLNEGFSKVRFEHKKPRQLGSGLSIRLGKPWEMHVRMSDMDGDTMIHAEVEVSRDYMQHLFSQRTPVVYEIIKILERNDIRCRIWSGRINGYVSSIVEDYRIKLATPSLPTLAWKPMVFSIGTVGIFYLTKYVLTVL